MMVLEFLKVRNFPTFNFRGVFFIPQLSRRKNRKIPRVNLIEVTGVGECASIVYIVCFNNIFL